MNEVLQRFPRPGRFCRAWASPQILLSALISLLGAGALLTGPAPALAATTARTASVRIAATQQLAYLDYEHRAYQAPGTSSRYDESVPAHRPITGSRTVLPVVGHATTRDGQHWLKVMLPGRPNSSTGWIKRYGTQKQFTGWNIQVSLASRQVRVYYAGRLSETFSAVVGKPSTPTPTGHFFVEESVIMPVDEPGGPYALALSARSNVLQDFDGGPGQIGIHGRDGLGGTLGQAQSHGCMRLSTPDITWLISRIGAGTPVTIS